MFRLIGWLTSLVVRLSLSVIFYATPLLGFWLASSLAAYFGGPNWQAWLAGALLFPIIPGAWELYAWTHRRREKKAWLTPADRLSLRTFAIGLVFLGVLLSVYPQTAFVALSTRGDWMLDGLKDARAEGARRLLFATAGGVEWLYRATRNNPYKAQVDKEAQQRADEAARQREQQLARQQEKETAKQHQKQIADAQSLFFHPPVSDEGQKATDDKKGNETEATEEPTVTPAAPDVKWPWKGATMHPAVAAMPASEETSIQSVARYIAKHEKDPVMRIKALHDYVADRIAYDSDSYFAGNIPDQDAQTVFEKHKSVCAGYANLMAALAEAINEKVVVVVGDARDPVAGDKLTGSGHAWNAACIKGRWYLIDACWDSGSVSREKGFTKNYRTDYFLPPPEVMIEDHFPERPTWQLLAKPLSQGDFLRQPMLRPRFQADELVLVSPLRVKNETEASALVMLKNPKNQWLMAALEQNGKQVGPNSEATNSENAQLSCPLPDKGTYRLNMFVNEKEEYGKYNFIGSVDFVSR